jgi:transposase
MRKSYSANLKTKVALAMLKEQETVAELAKKYEIHRSLLTRWKKEALEGLPDIFSSKKQKRKTDNDNLINELYQQIGQLKVENDWLKKKVDTINS